MSIFDGSLNALSRELHQNAVDHGFWDGYDPFDVRDTLCRLMLITSEVGEACEAVRHGDRENFNEELADIVIRVLDLADARGINLEHHLRKKMEINKSRPHMHGGKLA